MQELLAQLHALTQQQQQGVQIKTEPGTQQQLQHFAQHISQTPHPSVPIKQEASGLAGLGQLPNVHALRTPLIKTEGGAGSPQQLGLSPTCGFVSGFFL